MNEKRLIALIKDAERRHEVVRVDLDWYTLMVLLSQLQLALRHPGNPTHPARVTRAWLEQVIGLVGTVSPELAVHLSQGMEPTFDVPA